MSEITRDDVLAANPLSAHLAACGITLVGSGDQKRTNRCPAIQHRKDHLCVSVHLTKEVWHCNDCGSSGSVIDWIAIESGRSARDVYKELAGKLDPERTTESHQSKKLVATYDYTNEQGEVVFQVCRFEPKDFRQRRPDPGGGWIWNLIGVTRFLYRLPAILLAREVLIVEGEKDADNLVKLGFEATCNVGGAGKWLQAYSEFLTGKDIVIIPDNDKPGLEHSKMIVESLKSAGSLKVVALPTPAKDVSDFISLFSQPEAAVSALRELIAKTPHCLKPVPFFTMNELEGNYIRTQQRKDVHVFDLGIVFPSIRKCARPLIPGEVAAFMSDTGVGKTAILQTLARAAAGLPTLFFELELPQDLLFERFVQIETSSTGKAVEESYKADPTAKALTGLQHILVCPESGLTVEQIEDYIKRSELRFGMKPMLVLVDYIGLLRAPGSRGRYEAMSNVAEALRVIAKRADVIMILAVQISRPDKKSNTLEIGLHDAKDSGSIENSASMVLGAWRPDEETIKIKVLKNTKGRTGTTIECNFSGAVMKITERANPRYQ